MNADKEIVTGVSTAQVIQEGKARADTQIALAKHWATRLIEIVDQCDMSVAIGQKKYLQVEAWQVIGEFAGVSPVVEWTKPWIDEDEAGRVVGYECRVVLYNRDQEPVSSGESSCGFDSFPCKGKEGSEKKKAARSAAQTWALSRAYRNKYAFVAKLAGFEPTPAEEMTSGTTETQEGLPNCPKCGHNKSVIRGKKEYGGGYVCWTNHKVTPGCGAKWKFDGNESSKKTENPPKENKSDRLVTVKHTTGNKTAIFEETDTHKRLEKALYDHCDGDFIKIGTMLETLTAWKDSKGISHAGKKEIGAISEKVAVRAIERFNEEFGAI